MEHKLDAANLYEIAVTQKMLLYAASIDANAIRAAEIHEPEHTARWFETCVPPGNIVAFEHHVVVKGTSQGRGAKAQRESALASRCAQGKIRDRPSQCR